MSGFHLGRYYEEFSVGESIVHETSKTIVESDNNLFCLLTMNHHPIHLDKRYAAMSEHGRILVVGTLVFSLAVGLTVPDISGKAIANLSYESVEHMAPVFVDDTISARTQVLEKRESRTKLDRGLVRVFTVVSNQRDEVVLKFVRTVLVKRKA